jgi:hypothetical protein
MRHRGQEKSVDKTRLKYAMFLYGNMAHNGASLSEETPANLSKKNVRRECMARPIEPTPVLRGKDAARFIKMAENPEPAVVRKIDYKKVHEEIKRITDERTKKQLHV